MIMYTMTPQELLFPISQDSYKKQRIIDYNGISLLVEKNELNEYEVLRILSTDPNHYLHGPVQPGAKITII
ncbi:YlzJ-like family protein [Niallia sp. 01092]|uniref:YlzJ-like family protein n=1 Tax=unclassified Niallia TaxID=2837522 RepID=UPI003FD15FFE